MEEEVLTTDINLEEGSRDYEYLMKAENIKVRDGDDLIDFKIETNEEPVDEQTGTEGTEVEQSEVESPEVEELKDFSNVESVSEKLEANRSGFESMTEKAVESGKMTHTDIENMMTEYEKDGKLSDGTLAKLAEAGYPESFVRSYIQGQEALAQQYTNEIYNYAGGKENFDRYVAHLESISPTTLQALESAISNCDMNSIKGIMELTRTSLVSRYGKSQQRTVTQQVQQVNTPRVESFSSKADMIAAMSDPRYCRDAKYTHEVDTKVINSNF